MLLINWFRKFINPTNHFDNLSDELILNIFSYLDIKTLFLICAVSKRMNTIGNDNLFLFSIYSHYRKTENLSYDEKFNHESSYKKLIKAIPDELLLAKLQSAAYYFNIKITIKLNTTSQQFLFFKLFYKLAHHISEKPVGEFNSVLIGAMLFEINFIASQCPFGFDVKQSITTSAIDYQLTKILHKSYSEIEQLRYLVAFNEYIKKIDANIFENIVEKEAFLQKIEMVIQKKTIDEMQNSSLQKPTRT